MKRKVGPARVLAVTLSAAMAFSNVVTVSATTGDDAANLSSSQEVTEVTESSEADSEEVSAASEASSEEAVDEAKESENASVDVEEKTTEESTEESTEDELPLFEEVDPEEEGLQNPAEALVGEEPELPVEEVDPNEQTRVIIVMEGDSVLDKGYDTEDLADNNAAMNLSESIIAEQEETVEKISEEALDGEELEVNYNLSIITNAVSADVAYKDIEKIVKVDGVEAVYVAQKYEPMDTAEPMTITSGDMVGSYTTWAAGYTGAGTRIAIIDTGIDYDHPSFDAGAFEAHLSETAEAVGKTVDAYSLLTAEEIAAVLPNLNVAQRNADVSADQLYINEKIPFAFNYVDKNLDISHDNDEEGDHGTHVSGISTANYYVPTNDGYARQEVGVVGIAPDAQLITMKVFGTNGGAYSDDYMAAIEDALLLKADVVNLSLGSSAAGYSSDSEDYINQVFKKLEGTSTVVSISAGNSGRWSDDSTWGVNLSRDVNQDTVGSPGSYTNALTVASAVNSGMVGNYFATADGKKIFYADGSGSPAPKFETLDTNGDGTDYPFVLIAGYGNPEDYEGLDVTDKIVLVSRGSITFAQKQMNAEAAGAKAVVIYNNQAGTISMSLEGSTAVIPAVSITLADGELIASGAEQIADNAFAGTLSVNSKIGVKTDTADGYTMSDFSSYGVPASLDLKPEITAPGGNIYSTRDNGTYGLMSGTSMAAPSISGQSALVEQYIRENGLADQEGLSVRTLAQALMMGTAVPLHEDNDAQAPEFSPRSQGAGLANVYNAVTSPVYALVGAKDGNDGKVKAVLGDDPSKSGSYSFSFDLYNLTDDAQYYVLDSSVLTEQLYASQGVKYFYGTSHELNPSVSLVADDTALVYDINSDGAVNAQDRKLFLQVVNGTADVALVEQNQDYFDLNNDGVLNTKDVYVFAQVLKGASDAANFGLEVVKVQDKTNVNVQITLSEDDRNYLENFENGMYVDGFIYVKGNVDLSVPFLAFYGSWMDSPMFETFDFEEYVHNPNYDETPYTGVSRTNFLSIYPMGTEDEMFYIPNLFADDAQYVADRNAISSENGSKLGSQYYTLIRNANRVIMTITDKNTGAEYFRNVELENYAAFVYQGEWQNYLQWQDLLWAATDAEGNPLADGTEVEITIEAVPSYYDNVEDPSTLAGKGLYMTTPMVVDNTAPVLADAARSEEEGKFDLTVYDNRYTAAVLVLDREGEIIGRYAVDQMEKDQDVVVTVDAPEDIFYVEVFDYACNSTVYRINNTGHADTKYVTGITVDPEEITIEPWEIGELTATVSPNWLEEGYDEVTWESSNEDVVFVLDGLILGLDEGTAVVTATTVATDKKGNHLSAEVKVTVKKASDYEDLDIDKESIMAALTMAGTDKSVRKAIVEAIREHAAEKSAGNNSEDSAVESSDDAASEETSLEEEEDAVEEVADAASEASSLEEEEVVSEEDAEAANTDSNVEDSEVSSEASSEDTTEGGEQND